MDLDKINILKAMTRRMEWLGERQRVLAENIANADTPGYKPKDLKPTTFKDMVQGNEPHMGLATTSEGHMRGAGNSAWRPERKRGNFETAPNGNAVNLEDQMLAVAETQGDHNLMTNLYRKQVGMLRKALGPRSN